MGGFLFEFEAIRTPRRAAQVCGVVVSVRQHEDILSVWTQDSKDDDAIAKIRDAIKTNLELPPFVTIDYKRISASRGAAAPSRHRRDSCPPDEVVGGFFFDFEAVRTESSDCPESRPNSLKIKKETTHFHHSWRRVASMA